MSLVGLCSMLMTMLPAMSVIVDNRFSRSFYGHNHGNRSALPFAWRDEPLLARILIHDFARNKSIPQPQDMTILVNCRLARFFGPSRPRLFVERFPHRRRNVDCAATYDRLCPNESCFWGVTPIGISSGRHFFLQDDLNARGAVWTQCRLGVMFTVPKLGRGFKRALDWNRSRDVRISLGLNDTGAYQRGS